MTGPARWRACGWSRSRRGRATISMRVRDDMVNGFGLCHSGYVAALANSAFAFACNTYHE